MDWSARARACVTVSVALCANPLYSDSVSTHITRGKSTGAVATDSQDAVGTIRGQLRQRLASGDTAGKAETVVISEGVGIADTNNTPIARQAGVDAGAYDESESTWLQSTCMFSARRSYQVAMRRTNL